MAPFLSRALFFACLGEIEAFLKHDRHRVELFGFLLFVSCLTVFDLATVLIPPFFGTVKYALVRSNLQPSSPKVNAARQ